MHAGGCTSPLVFLLGLPMMPLLGFSNLPMALSSHSLEGLQWEEGHSAHSRAWGFGGFEVASKPTFLWLFGSQKGRVGQQGSSCEDAAHGDGTRTCVCEPQGSPQQFPQVSSNAVGQEGAGGVVGAGKGKSVGLVQGFQSAADGLTSITPYEEG